MSSLNHHHSRKLRKLRRRFDNKPIKSELFGIHVDFEYLGWVNQPVHFKYSPSALFGTVSF